MINENCFYDHKRIAFRRNSGATWSGITTWRSSTRRLVWRRRCFSSRSSGTRRPKLPRWRPYRRRLGKVHPFPGGALRTKTEESRLIFSPPPTPFHCGLCEASNLSLMTSKKPSFVFVLAAHNKNKNMSVTKKKIAICCD